MPKGLAYKPTSLPDKDLINPARVIVPRILTIDPINAEAERRVHLEAKHHDIHLQEAAER